MAQQFLNNVLGNVDSAPKAPQPSASAIPATTSSDDSSWYDSPYVKYVAIGVGALILLKLVTSSSPSKSTSKQIQV